MPKKDRELERAIPTHRQWETRSLVPLSGGLVPGVNGSLWMYRSVPMAPIVDARSEDDAARAGFGLYAAFQGLEQLAVPGMNRKVSKESYREFHALLLNVPTYFEAADGMPTTSYLNREFRNEMVMRREMLFGVKLRPSALRRKRGWKAAARDAVDSFIHTAMYGGSPMSDYDADIDEIDGVLARAGFTVPSKATLRWADSWWSHGRAKGVPVLPHDDHQHFTTSMAAKHHIEQHLDLDFCDAWPDEDIPGEYSISFAAANDFQLGYTSISDPATRWGVELLDAGARVVSIRGVVEPSKVTRGQLRSQKSRIQSDMEESWEKNKTPRAEQEKQQQELTELEAMYARGEAPPTLHDCSVIIGFDGRGIDMSKIAPRALELNPLIDLQSPAWYETMLCSDVRANPLIQEFPSTVVTAAGLTNISKVGDATGALLGFTERDSQPVYISSSAASAGDSFPLMSVFGSTGSGKSLVLQWLAHQWGLSKVPQVIVDPKQTSDFTDAVKASSGTVFSLDEFVNTDGPLDPIRYSVDAATGVQIAADMIAQVRPISSVDMDKYETPIASAIRYGVERGATATGQALIMAAEAGVIPREVVQQIVDFAETYPMFRATFGLQGGQSTVKMSDGITLFKVGKARFELPPPGLSDIRFATPNVRASVNVMRQIVRASIVSLSGRGGVLHIDEEWAYEKAAPDELEQLGRLARSMNVLVCIYTQSPKGPLSLGLGGFISRGVIGHVKAEGDDVSQADAALRLFGATNPDLLGRVVAPEKTAGAHSWNSLKALWDYHKDGTRTLVRPAVFFHADLNGNLAPVTVRIPDSFFQLATTNPLDMQRRALTRARTVEASPRSASNWTPPPGTSSTAS